ncbi:hypothetical protein Mapa_001521 [Marchantia paleacea]|nr:hypothetical protein Mapa_001521 [Marchantia paleacea]
MGNEKLGKESLTTPSQRRRRLSNITNLSLSANWSSHPREDSLLKSCSKSSDFQLQQENIALKKLLAEKEEALEVQAGSLEQMQKEFLIQLRRQSQVNEEIISFNSRLSKEGGQLRDQYKLLQHEYCQMTAAYRVQVNELQLKLTETQEQLKRLLEEQESKRSTPSPVEHTQVPRKPRSHAHRRHSTAGRIFLDNDWNHSTKLIPERADETVCRPEMRRRSGRVVVTKEAVPKLKLNTQPAPGSIRHINRYSDLIGLEPMAEVCEEEYSPCNSANTTSSSPHSENFSRSLLTSESNSSRTDDATTCSLSTRSSEISVSSAKGLQPLKTNKVNLVAPELQKSINSSSAPHFSRRVYNTLVSGSGRPVRKAVEIVGTYREPPLNTKMRRPS